MSTLKSSSNTKKIKIKCFSYVQILSVLLKKLHPMLQTHTIIIKITYRGHYLLLYLQQFNVFILFIHWRHQPIFLVYWILVNHQLVIHKRTLLCHDVKKNTKMEKREKGKLLFTCHLSMMYWKCLNRSKISTWNFKV